MFVVIFRARIRELDSGYADVAARMRALAMEQFGCLGFHAVGEGERWYDSYSVQVASVTREYHG